MIRLNDDNSEFLIALKYDDDDDMMRIINENGEFLNFAYD